MDVEFVGDVDGACVVRGRAAEGDCEAAASDVGVDDDGAELAGGSGGADGACVVGPRVVGPRVVGALACTAMTTMAAHSASQRMPRMCCFANARARATCARHTQTAMCSPASCGLRALLASTFDATVKRAVTDVTYVGIDVSSAVLGVVALRLSPADMALAVTHSACVKLPKSKPGDSRSDVLLHRAATLRHALLDVHAQGPLRVFIEDRLVTVSGFLTGASSGTRTHSPHDAHLRREETDVWLVRRGGQANSG